MGKTEPPRVITRYNLYMTLVKQYGVDNPFVLKRDGKEVYNFLNDKVTFTCCNNMSHQHTMTPLNILQLKYIYGANPCPICNKNRGVYNPYKKMSSTSTDDVGTSPGRIVYSEDPIEAAKQKAKVEAEIIAQKATLIENGKHVGSRVNNKNAPKVLNMNEFFKNRPDLARVFGDGNYNVNVAETIDDEEPIAESMSYDQYVANNNEFNSNIKNVNPFDGDSIYDLGHEEGVEGFSVNKIASMINQQNTEKVKSQEIKNTPEIYTKPVKSGHVGATIQTKREVYEETEDLGIEVALHPTDSESSNESNKNILLSETKELSIDDIDDF